MPATPLASTQDYANFIAKFDTFLFDCDGVLWHGDDLIPGVKAVLAHLRSLDKHLIFVTNNATKSRQGFKQKFDKLGIQVDIDEIFGSAYATVAYLKYVLKFPTDKRLYVIGESGLEDELRAEQISFTGGTSHDDCKFIPLMDFSDIKSDATIGGVVCGFDMHINYLKIAKAFRYLSDDPNCLFILTNDDSTFPTNTTTYPGSGAISAPLRFALPHRKPIVVGKPNTPMLDCILEKFKFDRERTCMVGDRLDTDILFGINGGTSTLLVLTGVVKMSEIEGDDKPIVPQYVIESLGDLQAVI